MAQHLNNISMSINRLAIEIEGIKQTQTKGVSAVTGPSVSNSQVDEIRSTLTDLKKHTDGIKADVTRDMNMLETMILRKCEITMNKMINDKINIAMETQKVNLKDLVATEMAKSSSSLGQDASDNDFEVTMAPPQPKSKGSRTKK